MPLPEAGAQELPSRCAEFECLPEPLLGGHGAKNAKIQCAVRSRLGVHLEILVQGYLRPKNCVNEGQDETTRRCGACSHSDALDEVNEPGDVFLDPRVGVAHLGDKEIDSLPVVLQLEIVPSEMSKLHELYEIGVVLH